MLDEFFRKMIDTGEISRDNYGRLNIWGEYIVLMPSGVLVKLVKELEKELGTEKSKTFLETLGEFHVESALKRYEKRYNIGNVSKSEILDFTYNILNSLGWGKVEINELDMDKKTATVIVKGGTLPSKYNILYGEKRFSSIDHYLSGLFRKHFSAIFEAELDVKEVQCMARGDRFCEFIVSRA